MPICTLLPPVLVELGCPVEDGRLGVDDFEFLAAGVTVDDFSDFEVLVQGDVRPALDTFCHTLTSTDHTHLNTSNLSKKLSNSGAVATRTNRPKNPNEAESRNQYCSYKVPRAGVAVVAAVRRPCPHS